MVKTFLHNYGPAATVDDSSRSGVSEPGHDDPDNQEAAKLKTIHDKSPGPDQWKRSLIVADPQSDLLMGQVTNAKAAVLVFSGSNDAVSMPLLTFDRYLA